MSEKIEAVRCVICPQPAPCAETCEPCWIKARGAIEALREPTEAMIHAGADEAGIHLHADNGPGGSGAVWRAMIDEALKD